MEWSYFDKYLQEEDTKLGDCISNHKDKTLVYRETREGQVYYIKKYIPYGKRKLWTALGLRKDRVLHYQRISRKLEKLGLPCVEAEYVQIQKRNFWERSSILVSKDAGIPLEEHWKKAGIVEEEVRRFYDIFISLVRNGIYPIDYNSHGILINEKGEWRLTDFDDYRLDIYLSSKLKKRLLRNLHRIYEEEERIPSDRELFRQEIQRVEEGLAWKESDLQK